MAESIINPEMPMGTHRDRFRRTMHFQKVNRIPHWEFGYWTETIQRWWEEGLAEKYDNNEKVETYFGVEPSVMVPTNYGFEPPFEGEPEVLEEKENSRIEKLPDGTIQEVQTKGQKTIPHYIKMPVENWDDWKRYKERMDPEDPERFQTDYEELGKKLMHSDDPVGIHIGSYLGWPRNWLGFENLALTVYDDRELVEDMVATITEVVYRQLEEALKYIEVDFASGWEDVCFRNGPIISPAMFEEIIVPHLSRVCSLLREHGCTVIWTDCDGDVTDLVPLWLDAGLNCMFPLEVFPGSDPVKYREEWGHQILLRGGLDKQKFAGTKQDILDELKRVEPVIEDGGFIPHADHRVPADVSYENYRYYVREKLAMLGWKDADIAEIEPIADMV